MSLVRKGNLYKSYFNLCDYTGKIPLCKSKWRKRRQNPINPNRTYENVQKELDELREHA